MTYWPCGPYPLYPIPPVPLLPMWPIPLYPIPPVGLIVHRPIPHWPLCLHTPVPLCPCGPHCPCAPCPLYPIALCVHIAHRPHCPCGPYPLYPIAPITHMAHYPMEGRGDGQWDTWGNSVQGVWGTGGMGHGAYGQWGHRGYRGTVSSGSACIPTGLPGHLFLLNVCKKRGLYTCYSDQLSGNFCEVTKMGRRFFIMSAIQSLRPKFLKSCMKKVHFRLFFEELEWCDWLKETSFSASNAVARQSLPSTYEDR